ncbi:hypothetical protein [Phyllobacterium myrsinacearum]|uniref:Uncharacterized protein n=1 Tax=Phyllobacterium myrsinacearum TaxID=28101 RepID=A0A839ERV9_9HYPH|nr:hypothetical protein [Phyllobacterium myrsinacearum]MBA8881669.1 hypothetical protein [Phyllobacterium myrsinacearum]
MSRNKNHPNKGPETHTVTIGDPVAMWEKLAWDVDVFQDIQRSYPAEVQPLVYAAINVCICAKSLEDWTRTIGIRSLRDKGQVIGEPEFNSLLLASVPEQSICSDVANTAKHSKFQEKNWLGGTVSIFWEEGDEDIPPGFALYHITPGEVASPFAFNTFEQLLNHWWEFLVSLDLAKGARPTPDWLRNKFNKIFR